MKEYGWAIVGPEGHTEASTCWGDEAAAWRGTGHDTPELVERAKAEGCRALRVRIFEVGPE